MSRDMQDDPPEFVLICLSCVLEKLEILLPQLHRANEKCAEASRPLANLAELTSQQKKTVADNIRAANQEVDEVFVDIEQALTSLEQIGQPRS
jgi:hypothetical protein